MKLSNKALKICIMFLLLVTTVFGERLVVLPGTIQGALGGKDWDPAGSITKMNLVGDDLYEFSAEFPKGNFEYKVAIDGAWTENYGSGGAKDGGNISITIPQDKSTVKFTFNYKTKEIKHDVKIEGFNLIPIITNKVEQKGKNAKYTATNELELGVLSQNLDMKSKFSYNFDYDKNSKTNKFTNLGEDADIKNLKIEELTADYKMGPVTTGLMINKTNIKGSTDYLGILDVNTESDKRKATKNPKDIAGNNIGVKISTDKFAKVDISASKYVADIYAEENKTEKTLATINAEKSFMKDKLTLGSSNLFYQVSHEGKDEDLLINGSLYGKLDVNKRLSLKGQVAYVPTGNIIDIKSGLATYYQTSGVYAGKWRFEFNPDNLPSGEITEDVTSVHLVGEFNGWNKDNYDFPLNKEGDIWVGYYDKATVEGKKFKYIYNKGGWDKGVGLTGINAQGGDLTVEETISVADGLENGLNAYFAEATYSFGNKHKGNVLLGTKFIGADVYIPFAKDELQYRENYDKVKKENGLVDYWLNVDYQLTKNNKLIAKQFIRNTDKDDMKVNNETILTLENKGIKGTEYIKATLTNDTVATDFHFGKKDYQVISLETKLDKLPLVKYAKLSTDQRIGSDSSKYYLETELKDTLYFINYIKGTVTYALDDHNYAFQGGDALQYFAEIKLTDIPMISSFVPYITVSYESDDNGNTGLIEHKAYYNKDDNDNDWLKKFKVETKLAHEALTKWDGLTVAYETRKIEEDRTKDKTPADFTKDEQYYVASARTFVDWYSILSLSTGYTFPKEIKGKVTYKYDLAHEKVSEFDDDGLRVELEKKIGKTTISASYNTKDKDEGKNYTKVMFKTVF